MPLRAIGLSCRGGFPTLQQAGKPVQSRGTSGLPGELPLVDSWHHAASNAVLLLCAGECHPHSGVIDSLGRARDWQAHCVSPLMQA